MSGTDLNEVKTRYGVRCAILGALVIMGLFLSVLTAVKAHAETDDRVRRGVHVIGDSITYRAHKGVLSPQNRPDRWTVDAFPGRRLTALTNPYVFWNQITYPSTTRSYTFSVSHINNPPRARISTVVIALGTNGTDEEMTVYQAAQMYAHQVRKIRAKNIWNRGPKKIVLVTPWKDPSIREGAINPHTGEPYLPYQWANKNIIYRKAIQHVVRNSSGIEMMSWHHHVSQHPEWLMDGIHPTAYGLRIWRNMLYRAIRD